jgi:hypothetical protein
VGQRVPSTRRGQGNLGRLDVGNLNLAGIQRVGEMRKTFGIRRATCDH